MLFGSIRVNSWLTSYIYGSFMELKQQEWLTETKDIKIWIDEYDGIFSDFDPRPYSERNMSDDFLNECNKLFRENSMPMVKRSSTTPISAKISTS